MKELFCSFFNSLNKTKIFYAITGRIENYPEEIHSDIDIIIPSNRFNDFWHFMKRLDQNGINWIQIISHEITAHYCIVTLSDDQNHHLLKPDVCSDYYRKGTLFLKADYLLQNRIYNAKGFYQLSPNKEFVYYLLKKVDKANLNNEQFSHLKQQWDNDQEGCKAAIKPFFTITNQAMVEQVFNRNDIGLLNSTLKQLKINLHQNLRFSVRDYLFKIKNRIERIIKPTGLVVAFMGPDGCGKTTIIDGVKKDLTEVFRRNKQFHLFPKEQNEINTVTNPHAKKSRGFIGSLSKLFYFLALYQTGFWFKVYPLKIRSTLVIFDRYFHDQMVDPMRYRHGAGLFWIRLFGFLIPKPDLWILLDAPAEVVQKRKSEVAEEETKRQLQEYRKLFSTLKNATVINANQQPEKVIYDAEKVIIDYLKNRNAKRSSRF